MREKHRPDMSEEEATALMHECLKASAYAGYYSLTAFVSCAWLRGLKSHAQVLQSELALLADGQ